MLPVAVTGLGCICAAGHTLDDCLTSIFRGARAPAPPVRFTSNHPIHYPVFEVAGFPDDPAMLRTSALGLHAAREALADAGLDRKTLAPLRVGVCVGTTIGCAMSNETFCRQAHAGVDPGMGPIEVIQHSNPASVIAREFGLSGPVQTVVNACSSGTDAVALAASWIRSDLCDVAIAGGADELARITYIGFIALMITDESPCKPFDLHRKGLNLGEGAGMLVLESEKTRAQRNRKARTFVLGYGSACDAYHLTAPHPDGAGLRRAIGEGFRTAGITAADVAFVNAHGTGTPENDRVESRVLREMMAGVPYLSTKGFTGHTLGASGAIEAAFTAACLERGEIPANAGFSTPDPELIVTPVWEVTRFTGTVALSESLAFGGNNAALILGRGETS